MSQLVIIKLVVMKIITLPPTRDGWSSLFVQLLQQLEDINSSSLPVLDKALKACEVCSTQLLALRKTLESHPFTDEGEEAFFFKSVKPRFHCYFIYWNKVFQI